LTAKDFKMIYDTHFDDLRRYLIYRSGDQDLSGDIAQNVFMKVWTKKIELASGNIKSLLFKMATDEFISHIRRKKVERAYSDSIDLRLVQESDSGDDELKDKKEQFKKALNQLPEKQRTALLMNKMQGLTYKEIAESLNLSEKAIEKRISQALGTLKQNLNQR
jgi:RNA polymerase sigma-70 factor (family 1)